MFIKMELLKHNGKFSSMFSQVMVFLTSLTLGLSFGDYPPRNTATPSFLFNPSNVTFQRGELAVLRCSVYNLGTKTVVWRRLDSSFPLTSGTMTVIGDERIHTEIGHVDYLNQWDLMIKNVQPEDEGIYECQVASRIKAFRKLVALTVLDPDTTEQEIFITGPQYVERGDPIVLQCNATGDLNPPEEMDWFRNGERLSSRRSKGIYISKQYSMTKKTFTSNLNISRARMRDDGTYVCRSSNLQITSTKVHILNAETFNKKRGTLLDENNDDRENAVTDKQTLDNSVASVKVGLIIIIVASILSFTCL